MNYNIKEFGDLRLFKYKNKVFYKNLWDKELVEYRGLVLDKDDNVVQRPFTKIFNWNEGGRKEDNVKQWVYWSQKVNGFMGAASIHEGKLLVSTTGSLDSPFSKLATKWLKDLPIRDNGYTYIFEIVDPSDPHIIDEKPGVYLLGARAKSMQASNHDFSEWMLDDTAKKFGCYRPKHGRATIKELLEAASVATHEGYVFWNDNCEYKIKTPFYLITKFLGRTRKDYRKEYVEEEFYPLIDAIEAQDNFREWHEQDKIKFIRGFLDAMPNM